jgi:hypothetical protein
MSVARFSLAALVLLMTVSAGSACASAATQSMPRVTAAPRETVTLTLEPYFRDLRLVRVLDGATPLTLLVDTGGGATLITPEVAARRGCRPYGRDVGHRMTGEPVEFARCDELTVSAGRWRRRLQPVAVFDVNALLPPELPRLDGVLALDAFRGQVVTFDWPGGRIIVQGAADAAPARHADGLPVRFATGDTGRMLSAFVPVVARQGRLWFLLDSGDLRGTLVARHVVRDGLLTLLPDGSLDLAIGQRPAANLPATVTDLVIDGALGASYLMQGPITLDLRAAP